jgi:HAD superfamily hydrolase (TIGR01549 family)
MKIKAIMYDLGDIFFEAHLWREWMFREFSKKKLFRGNFAEFYNLYDSFLSKETYTGKKSYAEAFDAFLLYMKMSDKEKPAFKKKAFEKKISFEKKRKLYPEVKKTLATLKKRGIRNIVITDNESTESEIRKNIIGRYGINPYIDHIMTSKDCGHTKSNKKIFQLTLKKNGLSPEEVLFVGHDEDEMISANASKIKTVEYNNYLKIPLKADYAISKFSALLDIAIS